MRAWSPRAVLLGVALVTAAGWVLSLFLGTRGLDRWLLPRYLAVNASALVFAAASFGAGLKVTDWLWPAWDRGPGRRTLAFACGLLVFFWGAFLLGVLGVLGPVLFFGWPGVLLAVGARPLAAECVAAWAHLRERRATLRWSDALTLAAGALALGLVYLAMLSPENINYDARWYHIAYAEHYTAAGGIVRFAEGPLVGAFPQFATVLYTWAFALPFGALFDRLELCLHLEWVLVLATLASIAPLARRLAPQGGRFRSAWLVYFLFPGIFLYDTAVQGGADHAAAYWVVPAWLALVRGWKRLGWREAALLAVPLSGIILTKYTALIAFVPVALALVGRALWRLALAWRRRERLEAVRAVREPVVLAGFGLLLTSAHWLKNVVFYGDPVYPLLYRHLPVRPWTEDSETWHRIYMLSNANPQGGWLDNLQGALRSLYDYHYNSTYNWIDFHGATPAFGSLFTASLVALPFLKGTRRLWALVLAAHLGVFTWFYVSHLERYLQVVVPWMVVATAVTLVLAWQQGGVPGRIGVIAVVGAQLVGQLDLPFIPSHRMNGKNPLLERSIQLLSGGYRGDTAQRVMVYGDWQEIGESLPTDAAVMLHAGTLHLGIGRKTLTDLHFGGQYGLSYARLGTLEAVDARLKELGVTHVGWASDYEDFDSLAGELLFRVYAQKYGQRHRSMSGWTLARVPDTAPHLENRDVLVVGCGYPYRTGIYTLEDLAVPRPITYLPHPQMTPRKEAADPNTLLPEVGSVAIQSDCRQPLALEGFRPLGHRRAALSFDLYTR